MVHGWHRQNRTGPVPGRYWLVRVCKGDKGANPSGVSMGIGRENVWARCGAGVVLVQAPHVCQCAARMGNILRVPIKPIVGSVGAVPTMPVQVSK